MKRTASAHRAPMTRRLLAAAVILVLASCGGGGSSPDHGAPAPQPEPGPVTAIAEVSSGYCSSLPGANGGFADLQSTAGSFAGAECGKYVVSCGGSGVDDKNFFAAVIPRAPGTTLRGTILSFGGESGDAFHTENVQEYADAGFRVILIAYESLLQGNGRYQAWQCARSDCPTYENVDDPGPKESACRPAEIIRYFKQAYDPENELGYCAQGHSAGSSEIAYALAHYGAGAYLDYVQLTAWTPLARPDYGCDPDRFNSTGKRDYSGENPDGTLQEVTNRPFAFDATLPFARQLMDQIFGLQPGECGAHPDPGVSDDSFARLHERGLVSSGAEYTYPNTVIDTYACAASDSMVDGNGSWYLEQIQDANPGQVFMETVLPGSSTPQNCTGEEVWWKSDGTTPSPIRQLTIDRMINSCVPMH